MEIGRDYMQNIISEVLPRIAKENAVLQAQLLMVDDAVAKETYEEFIEQTKKVIDYFMESEKEQLQKIRAAL